MISSSSGAGAGDIDLKLEFIGGEKLLMGEAQAFIYEREGKLTFKGGEEKEIACEIYRDNQRNYFLKSKILYMFDNLVDNKERKLNNGDKIVLMSKGAKYDGSNILMIFFSKNYMSEKGIEGISAKKSIFIPRRIATYNNLVDMSKRIVHHKWIFEEREHLK